MPRRRLALPRRPKVAAMCAKQSVFSSSSTRQRQWLFQGQSITGGRTSAEFSRRNRTAVTHLRRQGRRRRAHFLAHPKSRHNRHGWARAVRRCRFFGEDSPIHFGSQKFRCVAGPGLATKRQLINSALSPPKKHLNQFSPTVAITDRQAMGIRPNQPEQRVVCLRRTSNGHRTTKDQPDTEEAGLE